MIITSAKGPIWSPIHSVPRGLTRLSQRCSQTVSEEHLYLLPWTRLAAMFWWTCFQSSFFYSQAIEYKLFVRLFSALFLTKHNQFDRKFTKSYTVWWHWLDGCTPQLETYIPLGMCPQWRQVWRDWDNFTRLTFHIVNSPGPKKRNSIMNAIV